MTIINISETEVNVWLSVFLRIAATFIYNSIAKYQNYVFLFFFLLSLIY